VSDARIVHGARCAWWDSIDKVATKPSGLPCCPHCGGVLMEVENEATWWDQVDRYGAKGNPGYRAFIEWLRGRCFRDFQTALDAHRLSLSLAGAEPRAFQAGDRVAVDDSALAELRAIFRDATGKEPPPNNVGTVDEVHGDTLLIDFDDGGCAPYPASQAHHIPDDPAAAGKDT
jgi:hypothetical protein